MIVKLKFETLIKMVKEPKKGDNPCFPAAFSREESGIGVAPPPLCLKISERVACSWKGRGGGGVVKGTH